MLKGFSISIIMVIFTLGAPLAQADALRDPTRPYSARSVVKAQDLSFEVSAIFASKQRRVAVVNGRTVTEGEQIDGAIVVAILNDSLRLKLGDREISVRVVPSGLRK